MGPIEPRESRFLRTLPGESHFRSTHEGSEIISGSVSASVHSLSDSPSTFHDRMSFRIHNLLRDGRDCLAALPGSNLGKGKGYSIGTSASCTSEIAIQVNDQAEHRPTRCHDSKLEKEIRALGCEGLVKKRPADRQDTDRRALSFGPLCRTQPRSLHPTAATYSLFQGPRITSFHRATSRSDRRPGIDATSLDLSTDRRRGHRRRHASLKHTLDRNTVLRHERSKSTGSSPSFRNRLAIRTLAFVQLYTTNRSSQVIF